MTTGHSTRGARKIAVIPGDGIGVEVTAEALKSLRAVSPALRHPIELVEFDWGAERWLRDGTTLPKGAMEDLRDHYAAILFGALGDPRVPEQVHARDILLGLRFQLDLYINLRPVKLLHERLTPLKNKRLSDIDMLVFRENTEGLYAGVGGNFKKGTADEIAINEDVNTRKGVERILRAAFEAARGRRKKVCMSDKANALTYAHGLWQRTFAELKREYADVEASHLYVDVAAMEMVRAPERFDVLVTSNMFGDILTDLGAAIVGGLGLAGSGNIHPGRCSLFEPVHGSAPDIAGQGVANPLGAISSMAMMLDHLGEAAAAARVQAAVARVVTDGAVTRDLGGVLTTSACGDLVADAVGQAA
ncbi:MAG: 3-isopropylmalate dehydrogenase [Polyangia bacterium]